MRNEMISSCNLSINPIKIIECERLWKLKKNKGKIRIVSNKKNTNLMGMNIYVKCKMQQMCLLGL